MKTILALIPVLALVISCASGTPKAKEAAEAQTTKAKTTAETMKSDAKQEAAKAETTAKAHIEAAEGDVVCVNKTDERKLSAVKTEAGGCEVHYFKAGADNTVGSAQKGVEHCQGVVAKIKANLTAAGFECK